MSSVFGFWCGRFWLGIHWYKDKGRMLFSHRYKLGCIRIGGLVIAVRWNKRAGDKA